MASSSSPVRELQEELKDAGNSLLMPPSNIGELLSLLDRAEHLLSRVEQAPSSSMQDALLPVMKALIAQELLRHMDVDVKVSVASCFSEITRITAPEAPYDDEVMKEIFKLTIMALEKLSLASGRCYTKSVSILDTIAQVRSCLVMLDLECDELIVEMFQLFLNTIRSDHPHSVLSDMETIMTLVIDESEDISAELLIPLLTIVKKENQNISSLSYKLGENVLEKCAAKLRPYLSEGVQFMGCHLNDFAEVVHLICQDASGDKHPVAKDLGPDAICCGGADPHMDDSSISFRNGGTGQARGTVTLRDEDSSKTLEHCQIKSTDARSEAHLDHVDPIEAVNQEIEPEFVPKKRGRKPNSLIKPEEGYDNSWINGERKALPLPHHGKNHENKVASSSKDSAKESAQSKPQKRTKSQVFSSNTSHSKNKSASPSQYHSLPDESHHKNGRPKKKGKLMREDAVLDLASVPKGDSAQRKASQSADANSTKGSEIKGNLKVRSKRGLRKNAVASETNLQKTLAPSNVVKLEDDVLSDPEVKKEPSVLMDGNKRRRGNTISGKHATEESRGKKMVSFSATRSPNRDERQLKEASNTKCQRKHTPVKKEVSEMPHEMKNCGKELIGCKVKVWWPLDRTFYEGAIYSFDPIEKKHKVLYADGDEETLDLRKERWVIVGKNNLLEQGQETNAPSSDALSDVPQKKKPKANKDTSTKLKNFVSSSKSGQSSGSKSKVECPKSGKKSPKGDTLCVVKAGNVISETCAELKNKAEKTDGSSKTTARKSIKKSRRDSSWSSKGESTQVTDSHTTNAAKLKNMPSPSQDPVDVKAREVKTGKKQQRSVNS